ncbi:MAG: tetratricopeptide repeat protein [Terriglobales bacterium]
MRCKGLSLLLTLAMLAGAAAYAQTATIPGGPSESDSLKAMVAIFNDPNSQPSAFDAAVDSFERQFPKSTNMIRVLVTAVRYHRLRQEFLPELHYGMAALKLDPGDLYVMSSLGMAIPDNVNPNDLDMDELLSQAKGYDEAVLATTGTFQITAQGFVFSGIHYTKKQAHELDDNLSGPAYISLGRIAMMRQKYADAVTAFRSALAYQPTADTQAQTYYYIGAAEVAAQQNTAAKADLAKARSLAPSSQLLQKMIAIQETKLSGN